MSSDIVAVEPADPKWPALYLKEAEAIRASLGPAGPRLWFEHVRSTAVPGLAAKPIIDLLLIPTDGTWPGEILRATLATLDYVFWDGNPDPHHLFFVKGMPPFGTRRTHHVHVRSPESAAPILAFRDRLRARPDVAHAYEALKRELATRFLADREAYTRGKDQFIARALAEASAESDPLSSRRDS